MARRALWRVHLSFNFGYLGARGELSSTQELERRLCLGSRSCKKEKMKWELQLELGKRCLRAAA